MGSDSKKSERLGKVREGEEVVLLNSVSREKPMEFVG